MIDVDLDDETIERVRELYAAEISFMDEWVGRLMNRLADQKVLDETVVIYSSDHGLTLGEHGIVGKHASRAQWHVYHVPFMIRHPEGKLAGEWSDYFASNHDIPRTALSFMGTRAPGMMTGEDLSVIFDGKGPAAAAALHVLLRRPRARRRLRLVLHRRQRRAPQAPLRQEERPGGARGRGRPAPRARRQVLAHPRGRGRRHAAAVQPEGGKAVLGG